MRIFSNHHIGLVRVGTQRLCRFAGRLVRDRIIIELLETVCLGEPGFADGLAVAVARCRERCGDERKHVRRCQRVEVFMANDFEAIDLSRLRAHAREDAPSRAEPIPAPIKREAVPLPLDHALGIELADVCPGAI